VHAFSHIEKPETSAWHSALRTVVFKAGRSRWNFGDVDTWTEGRKSTAGTDRTPYVSGTIASCSTHGFDP